MTLAGVKFIFTSLVPTHYIMMLGHNVESVAKLLISSAPTRKDRKLALMEYFSRSKLYARSRRAGLHCSAPRSN
jgi:fatty-acyl-CoA synthase